MSLYLNMSSTLKKLIFSLFLIMFYLDPSLLVHAISPETEDSMIQEVIIYTKSSCPYCINAKALLDDKLIKYTEFNLEEDENAGNFSAIREQLIREDIPLTVPQIYIGGKRIGGCDSLYELDKNGELDKLIKSNNLS